MDGRMYGSMAFLTQDGWCAQICLWQERGDILSSLRRRSMMVHKALNEMEGITCNKADGALYAFPRIRLSNKAVQAAADKGIPTDEYYCLKVKILVFNTSR